MSWYEQAAEKLRNESNQVIGNKESAMKNQVRDALVDFCRQDEEFAQAVVQGGKFQDCMVAVAKGVGSSISDLEAYRRAVRFYFDGAKVEFQMKIVLGPASTAEDEQGGILLDLASFF